MSDSPLPRRAGARLTLPAARASGGIGAIPARHELGVAREEDDYPAVALTASYLLFYAQSRCRTRKMPGPTSREEVRIRSAMPEGQTVPDDQIALIPGSRSGSRPVRSAAVKSRTTVASTAASDWPISPMRTAVLAPELSRTTIEVRGTVGPGRVSLPGHGGPGEGGPAEEGQPEARGVSVGGARPTLPLRPTRGRATLVLHRGPTTRYNTSSCANSDQPGVSQYVTVLAARR